MTDSWPYHDNAPAVRHLQLVPNPYALDSTIRTASADRAETFPGSRVYLGTTGHTTPPPPPQPVLAPMLRGVTVSWDPHGNATVTGLEELDGQCTPPAEVGPPITGVMVRREFPGIDAFLSPLVFDRGREWLVDDGSLVILDAHGRGIAELAPGTWSGVEDMFAEETARG